MFKQSIATIRGDLSNISAPPFVLDTKSAVELPAFWAERPSVFVAPAASSDPVERALLVLKWFLSSLRNQQYAGRTEAEGVKKPINAFLGEVFLAKWEDEAGLTRLVSEQVRCVYNGPSLLVSKY
jgi:oxysterol-binding protein-related protein 9/10/11